jgi:hypothetical protein
MIRSHRPADPMAYANFTLGRLEDFGDDLPGLLAASKARRITDYIRDSDCRCSFECAIFATMVYRPWRLGRVMAVGGIADGAPGGDLAYETRAQSGAKRRAD